jgi:hypothetical protein
MVELIETAPGNHLVLVWDPGEIGWVVGERRGLWWHAHPSDGGYGRLSPTHWTELPEPPAHTPDASTTR